MAGKLMEQMHHSIPIPGSRVAGWLPLSGGCGIKAVMLLFIGLS
jgi:hypothetical protein